MPKGRLLGLSADGRCAKSNLEIGRYAAFPLTATLTHSPTPPCADIHSPLISPSIPQEQIEWFGKHKKPVRPVPPINMTIGDNVMATDPAKAAEGGAIADKSKGKAAAVEEEHPVADQKMRDAMDKDDSEEDDNDEDEDEDDEPVGKFYLYFCCAKGLSWPTCSDLFNSRRRWARGDRPFKHYWRSSHPRACNRLCESS